MTALELISLLPLIITLTVGYVLGVFLSLYLIGKLIELFEWLGELIKNTYNRNNKK
jgi:hypothetical protein